MFGDNAFQIVGRLLSNFAQRAQGKDARFTRKAMEASAQQRLTFEMQKMSAVLGFAGAINKMPPGQREQALAAITQKLPGLDVAAFVAKASGDDADIVDLLAKMGPGGRRLGMDFFNANGPEAFRAEYGRLVEDGDKNDIPRIHAILSSYYGAFEKIEPGSAEALRAAQPMTTAELRQTGILSDADMLVVERAVVKPNNVFENFAVTSGADEAKEVMKLRVKRDHFVGILRAAGVDPSVLLGKSGEIKDDLRTDAAGQRVSRKQQEVNMLLRASRALFVGNDATNANAALAQARGLLETDPDLQREDLLLKLLPEALVREFPELGVGATYGDALGEPLRSPEALAAAKASAQATAKARGEASAGVDLAQRGIGTIDALLEEIQADETIVGLIGSAREAGKTVKEVVQDLASTTGVDLRGVFDGAQALAATDSELSTEEQFELFGNPKLSVIELYGNAIGMIMARLTHEGQRIPVDTIKRSIDSLKLRGLTGATSAVERLNFVKEQLDIQLAASEKRFPGITGPAEAAGAEDFSSMTREQIEAELAKEEAK